MLATPAGERHVVALRMVSNLLSGAGYWIVMLGADVPAEALVASVLRHRPDVICMSATMPAVSGRVLESIAAGPGGMADGAVRNRRPRPEQPAAIAGWGRNLPARLRCRRGRRRQGQARGTELRGAGTDATAATNWAGNYAYRARAVHAPSTLEQVREIVAAAPRVRVLGSRHSFTDIADSVELVTLDRLAPNVVVDREAMTVTIGGAVRYGELAVELAREGLALANLASLPHIAVAGAVSTATHGSGDGNGNLATAVGALEFVTSDGGVRSRFARRSRFRRARGRSRRRRRGYPDHARRRARL